MNEKRNIVKRTMPQTQSEDPAAPDTMAEIADTELQKITCLLTPLQREIYHHLLNKGRQTAVNVAKAVKKKKAKEVNPDLYNMKKMNLLEYNSLDKLWNIKAAAARDNDERTGDKVTDNSSESVDDADNNTGEVTAGTELAVNMSQLTDLQKSIFTFLKSNKPSRALTIAKGVGKTTAKAVNPDLYKMKDLHLLSQDEMEKLWTVDTGLAHTLSGSPNSSSEDSSANGGVTTATGPMVLRETTLHGNLLSPNQSHIEIDVCKLPDKDTRRDSGIKVTSPYPDNTGRDEPNLTEPHTRSYLQYGSEMLSAPLNVTKNYYISMQGCSAFTVGDTTCLSKWDAEPVTEGDINFQHEYRDPDITTQEAEPEQDSALGQSQQSGDDLIGELSLEEDEGPLCAPCTSSPMPSSCYKQTLNISEICDTLEYVTLDN